MTAQTIPLHLEIEEPKSIPAAYRKRWADLIQAVGPYDPPYLIFLGELLGTTPSTRIAERGCCS